MVVNVTKKKVIGLILMPDDPKVSYAECEFICVLPSVSRCCLMLLPSVSRYLMRLPSESRCLMLHWCALLWW